VKLADKIKNLRKSRQISLTELANRAGVNKGYLSSLENGRQNNPGLDKLSMIAKELGVDINYFSKEFDPQKSIKNQSLPRGLAQFAADRKKEKIPLSEADISDLSKIEFRGVSNFSAMEYAMIYASLEVSWKNKKK